MADWRMSSADLIPPRLLSLPVFGEGDRAKRGRVGLLGVRLSRASLLRESGRDARGPEAPPGAYGATLPEDGEG